ncbi:NDP-sugar synthase [Candidatus Woesearchaeota archaeon]|nr:NDP-sugar synthase [Candidatus Woesearchaeota archaeon]
MDSLDKKVLKDVSVVLTSGGKGTRNRPISLYSATSMIPKGLMRVMGIPLSELQIEMLRAESIGQFYIITRYLENRDQLSNRFGDGRVRFGVDIAYSEPLEDILNNGSGDAILRNITNHNIPGHSIVLANDNVYEANWTEAVKFHKERGAVITILATQMNPRETIGDYGLLDVDNTAGKVTKIIEKPKSEKELLSALNLSVSARLADIVAQVNTAGYILDNAALVAIAQEDWVVSGRRKKSGEFDMAGNLIKGLVERAYPVYAMVIDNWADLGSNPKYLKSVERALAGEFPSIDKVLASRGYTNIGNNTLVHQRTYERRYNGGKSLKDLVETGAVEIGPNVLIGSDVRIKEGVKIRYSSIEKDSNIGQNAAVSHSVIFPYCIIGENARIERSILGLQVHVNSSGDEPTTIEANSFLGPDISVPRGYHLVGVRVFPPYEFKPDTRTIAGRILMPSQQSYLKSLKE